MATYLAKMKIHVGEIEMEQEFGDEKNKVVQNGDIKSGQNIFGDFKNAT